MVQMNKPRKAPEVGSPITFMGRKIETLANGLTRVTRKGKEPNDFPNFTRAMDAICFATGLI